MTERGHVVTTTSGAVRGHDHGGAVRFLGIPFAGPVDGRNRFRPPVPPAGWGGIREADTWAPPVPQIPEEGDDTREHLWTRHLPIEQSEAGLYLNLWTPHPDPSAKRPVMVWLHGGGFVAGAPTRPREEGTNLALRGDVVVVSPTHRLGVSGYLFLDQLTAGRHRTANLGLLDIVAALEWVAENIQAFGGDPDNVTVFGESGGAAKTHALLAMPRARGLIHKAILHAGAFSDVGMIRTATPDEATDRSLRYLYSIGIDPTDTESLSALTREQLVEADHRFDTSLIGWRPVVDGVELPKPPEVAIAEGAAREVPLIIGSSRHEADVLTSYAEPFGNQDLHHLAARIGPLGWSIIEHYRARRRSASALDVALAVETDFMFRVPGIHLAETQATRGQRDVYMYLFDYPYTRSPVPGFRATHGSETAFAFGNTDVTAVTADDPAAAELSARLLAAWAGFARNGDPNHADLPAWPPYSSTDRSTLIFGAHPYVEINPQGADRDAWQATPDRSAPGTR